MSTAVPTAADLLVTRLAAHSVRHIFGYPGGQLTPIYDALYRQEAIRHILARDEQAAAFMADGYARATGRPGVCLAVCGPGVYNAATALATSFTDSVPVLLISGQIYKAGKGLRSGYYHENAQLSACATFTKGRFRPEDCLEVVEQLDQALALLITGRPGPVLFEIPLDVLREELQPSSFRRVDLAGHQWDRTEAEQQETLRRLVVDIASRTPPSPSAPSPTTSEKTALAELVKQWERPIVLAGGGVLTAGAEGALLRVAECLGAPVFHTLMGKSGFPADHPLAAGLPWCRATSDLTNMESYFSPLFTQTDGVLAVGCRFSQATTGSWTLPLSVPELAHIDIDPAEIGRHYRPTLGICADAREALSGLLGLLPLEPRHPWATIAPQREPWRLPGIDLIGPMRRVLPRDAIVVADITRLSYIMLAEFPVYQPRTFLHPAGFVPMGFGIPAALGAKAAMPERTVVAVLGDGCFLMCGMELATAVQEKLPIVIVLINDGSLTLIKAIQQRRYESRFIGVDLRNPDFALFAQAFGVRSWQVKSDPEFEAALREAAACGEPALVEVRL